VEVFPPPLDNSQNATQELAPENIGGLDLVSSLPGVNVLPGQIDSGSHSEVTASRDIELTWEIGSFILSNFNIPESQHLATLTSSLQTIDPQPITLSTSLLYLYHGSSLTGEPPPDDLAIDVSPFRPGPGEHTGPVAVTSPSLHHGPSRFTVGPMEWGITSATVDSQESTVTINLDPNPEAGSLSHLTINFSGVQFIPGDSSKPGSVIISKDPHAQVTAGMLTDGIQDTPPDYLAFNFPSRSPA
jgi:hypothetical protein